MFTKFFNGQSFDKRYSALVPYIKNKDKQDELINNQDFKDLYDRNSSIIETFLYELSKNYKPIEITKLINKYIFKLEEKELRELILLYLNLSNEDKKNKKFFKYYDDKHKLNRSEEELNREHDIDATYNRLKKGTEMFHNISLDSLYKLLDYNEREFINSLLSNKNGWDTFILLFEDRYHANFQSLIKLLNKALIDGTIINIDVYDTLGEAKFNELIFTLLSNHNLEVAKHIKTLIKNNRHDLIIDMINNNLIGDQIFIDSINANDLKDKDLIERLESIRVKKQINN